MVSAFMAHLAVIRLRGRGGVIIGGGRPFSARPFGEHAEEASDIAHDLEGVLVGEIAPDARLPDLSTAGETACQRHCRLRRRDGLGFPPMTLDPKGFASSGVPVSGIADRSHALGRFSGAPRFRG